MDYIETCRGLTGMLFGHDFKPRYDEGPPSQMNANMCSEYFMLEYMKESKPRTYVCDVCERCGTTVRRKR